MPQSSSFRNAYLAPCLFGVREGEAVRSGVMPSRRSADRSEKIWTQTTNTLGLFVVWQNFICPIYHDRTLSTLCSVIELFPSHISWQNFVYSILHDKTLSALHSTIELPLPYSPWENFFFNQISYDRTLSTLYSMTELVLSYIPREKLFLDPKFHDRTFSTLYYKNRTYPIFCNRTFF